ncbi:LIC_13387 family protein [Hyphococcus sp.]|uniref:LIC_13387 family protein n=1 Tax=Hyphococcus sp. TaxID=2038636 RepID=UPI00208768C9|nr:MAG: hypothetical protein DHS20C04_31310 [Marinicaulis sp.]
MNPQWVITAGALVFFILGALHLRLTVMDLKNPKAFIPAKRELLEELQNTRINLRKDVKNFWLSYLGFHFSHSVGILFYALAVMYCALVRPDIFSDIVARIGIVAFGASYVLMARSFWFIIPLVGSMLGVSLIAIGIAMLH